MKVVIVGAGSVGSSIARELLAHKHEILLIDLKPLMDADPAFKREASDCGGVPFAGGATPVGHRVCLL